MPRYEIEGLPELRRALERLGRPEAVNQALGAGQKKWAEGFLARTEELVPFSSGTLRQSARVGEPTSVGSEVATEFGYGGDASDYAIVQHERLDYEHNYGQAKYLEEPLMADPVSYARTAGKDLALWIRRNIGG